MAIYRQRKLVNINLALAKPDNPIKGVEYRDREQESWLNTYAKKRSPIPRSNIYYLHLAK
jgi:hypothetical protein